MVTLMSCATTEVVTKSSTKIGASMMDSAEMGLAGVDNIIKAWPYVSGVIRGTFINKYELEVPQDIKVVLDRLTELVYIESDVLTGRDKGEIIGLVFALEALATDHAIDILDKKILF